MVTQSVNNFKITNGMSSNSNHTQKPKSKINNTIKHIYANSTIKNIIKIKT